MTLRTVPKRGWLVLGLVLLLAGCGAPTGGQTAVGVDQNGSPVAYVVMCEGHIDGLTLYHGDNDRSVTVADVDAPAPVTTTAQVDLADPTDGWRVRTPLAALVDGTVYAMYGGSLDNSSSSAHVQFTTDQLAALRPGQVLTQEYDEKKDDVLNVISAVADFQEHACDDWA